MMPHNKFMAWRKDLGVEFDETKFAKMQSIYRCTNVTKYRSFQYINAERVSV